jgi:hypothetical protein
LARFPVLFLIVVVLYGLIIRPLFLDRDALAVETIFILASFFSVSDLFDHIRSMMAPTSHPPF